MCVWRESLLAAGAHGVTERCSHKAQPHTGRMLPAVGPCPPQTVALGQNTHRHCWGPPGAWSTSPGSPGLTLETEICVRTAPEHEPPPCPWRHHDLRFTGGGRAVSLDSCSLPVLRGRDRLCVLQDRSLPCFCSHSSRDGHSPCGCCRALLWAENSSL